MSDGTTAGTTLVTDIRPGPESATPQYLTNIGGALYFSAQQFVFDMEVWRIPPDTQPPTVAAAQFEFDRALEVRLTFSEPMHPATLSSDDLKILNLTTQQQFVAQDVTLSDAGTVATFALPLSLTDGDYQFKLEAGAVADLAGNALAAPFVLEGPDVFILAADANRDRVVNHVDFDILAANFGQSDRKFTQGDFNYDTIVNLRDFNILASRFGTALGPQARTSSFAQIPFGSQFFEDDDAFGDGCMTL